MYIKSGPIFPADPVYIFFWASSPELYAFSAERSHYPAALYDLPLPRVTSLTETVAERCLRQMRDDSATHSFPVSHLHRE